MPGGWRAWKPAPGGGHGRADGGAADGERAFQVNGRAVTLERLYGHATAELPGRGGVGLGEFRVLGASQADEQGTDRLCADGLSKGLQRLYRARKKDPVL